MYEASHYLNKSTMKTLLRCYINHAAAYCTDPCQDTLKAFLTTTREGPNQRSFGPGMGWMKLECNHSGTDSSGQLGFPPAFTPSMSLPETAQKRAVSGNISQWQLLKFTWRSRGRTADVPRGVRRGGPLEQGAGRAELEKCSGECR